MVRIGRAEVAHAAPRGVCIKRIKRIPKKKNRKTRLRPQRTPPGGWEGMFHGETTEIRRCQGYGVGRRDR